MCEHVHISRWSHLVMAEMVMGGAERESVYLRASNERCLSGRFASSAQRSKRRFGSRSTVVQPGRAPQWELDRFGLLIPPRPGGHAARG